MTMPDEQIELQRHADECASVAVVNFFRLRELPAPSVEDVSRMFGLLRAASKGAPAPAPTCVEVLNVLAGGCNFLCVLGVIPPALWHEPRLVLTHYLDLGCHLFVFYRWRDPADGSAASHVVVAEGYDERGMVVLNGDPNLPSREVIELEPAEVTPAELEQAKERIETHPHGARQLLPFYPCMTEAAPFGLTPHFVAVYPGDLSADLNALVDGLALEHQGRGPRR
jgi:hypothetical protein